MSDTPDPFPKRPLPPFLCATPASSPPQPHVPSQSTSSWPTPIPEIPLTCKLYTPGTVTWATAFGSPFAGCLVLALNYRRMCLRGKAAKALAWGALVTIVILILAFNLSDEWNLLFRGASVGVLIGMHRLAKNLQGEFVSQHRNRGGRIGSRWIGIGIGFICCFVMLAGLVSWAFYQAGLPEMPNRTADITGMYEIVYSKDISRKQADSVCNALVQIGYFKEGSRASVGLSKDHERIIIWLVINETTALKDSPHRGVFHSIAVKALQSLQYDKGILRLISSEGTRLGEEEVDCISEK